MTTPELVDRALGNGPSEAKALLGEIRGHLNSIKSSLIGATNEQDKQKVVTTLKELLTKLKSINVSDKSKLDAMLAGLESGVDEIKLKQIDVFVYDLNAKEKELNAADIELLKSSLAVLKTTKDQLNALKSTAQHENMKTELKNKIIEKSKTFMGGFLTPMIVGVLDMIDKNNKPAQAPTGTGFKDILSGIFGGIMDKIKYAIVMGVAGMVPGLGELIKQYDNLSKKGAGGVVDAALNAGSEKIDDLKEKFKPYLKSALKNYIKDTLGKKDVPDEKIDATLEEFLSENDALLNSLKFWENLQSKTGGLEININSDLILEIFAGFLKGGILGFKFFSKLIQKDIISVKDVAVDTGGDFVQYGIVTFNIIKDTASKLFSQVSFEDLSKSIEQLHLSDHEKQLLVLLVYRKGGLFFDVMGSVAGAVTKGLLYLPAFAGQDMSQFSARWHSMFGNYDKQLSLIEKISNKISPDIIGDNMKLLKQDVTKLKDFYTFWNWFGTVETEWKQSGLSLGDFVKNNKNSALITGAAKNIFENVEWEKYTDVKSMRAQLATNISTIGSTLEKRVLDTSAIFGDFVKGGLSEKAVYQNFAKQMNRTGTALGELVRNDDFFGLKKIKNLFVDRVRLGQSLSEKIGLSDDLFLAFEDVNDFKKWSNELKVLARKTPGAVNMLFQKMPIIAVGGIQLSKDDPSFKSFATDMLGLIPFVGPMMLVSSSNWNIKLSGEGVQVSGDIAQAGIGVGLFGLDTYCLVKAASLDGLKGVGKMLSQPAFDLIELAGMISRGGAYSGKFAKDTMRIWGKEGTAQMFKYTGESIVNTFKNINWKSLAKSPKTLAVLLVLTVGTWIAHESGIFDSNPELKKELDRLAKDGLQQGDFEDYQKKLKETWATMQPDEKSEQLKNIIRLRSGVVGMPTIGNSDIAVTDKKIDINVEKFLPLNELIEFKDDMLARFKKIGFVGDDSVLDIQIVFDKAIEQFVSGLGTMANGFKLDPTKNLNNMGLEDVQSIISIIDYFRGLGYDTIIDGARPINLMKTILTKYGYDEKTINGIVGMYDFVLNNGLDTDGLLQYAISQSGMDKDSASRLVAVFKQVYSMVI